MEEKALTDLNVFYIPIILEIHKKGFDLVTHLTSLKTKPQQINVYL